METIQNYYSESRLIQAFFPKKTFQSQNACVLAFEYNISWEIDFFALQISQWSCDI